MYFKTVLKFSTSGAFKGPDANDWGTFSFYLFWTNMKYCCHCKSVRTIHLNKQLQLQVLKYH